MYRINDYTTAQAGQTGERYLKLEACLESGDSGEDGSDLADILAAIFEFPMVVHNGFVPTRVDDTSELAEIINPPVLTVYNKMPSHLEELSLYRIVDSDDLHLSVEVVGSDEGADVYDAGSLATVIDAKFGMDEVWVSSVSLGGFRLRGGVDTLPASGSFVVVRTYDELEARGYGSK
jgi:hypothetical protein